MLTFGLASMTAASLFINAVQALLQLVMIIMFCYGRRKQASDTRTGMNCMCGGLLEILQSAVKSYGEKNNSSYP